MGTHAHSSDKIPKELSLPYRNEFLLQGGLGFLCTPSLGQQIHCRLWPTIFFICCLAYYYPVIITPLLLAPLVSHRLPIWPCSCSCQGHSWLQHCLIQGPHSAHLTRPISSFDLRFDDWGLLLKVSFTDLWSSSLLHPPPTLTTSPASLPPSKLEAESSDLLSLCAFTPCWSHLDQEP